ncbi:glycosyltransferase [bacterium]|nr:glycosyltransferase [bacterium]
MTKRTRRSIAWLYSFPYKDNCILRQAIASLAEAGYDVTIYDTCFSRWIDTAADASYTHRYFPAVFAYGRLKCNPFVRMALRLFASRHDLIVASMPDTALIGLIGARLHRIPLIYYPFEMWGEDNSGFSKSSKWRKIEDYLLQNKTSLAAVVTQNEYRASVYRHSRRCCVEPVVVRNYMRSCLVSPAGTLKHRLGVSQDVKVVVYEGSIQQERNLVELVRAVEYFPPNSVLALIGPVYEGYRQELMEAIASSPAADRCIILPPVAHEDLLALVSDADAGVLMYAPINLNNYYCAPCKLSDYVIAGIPVIVPAFPPLHDALAEYDIGTCFDEQSSRSIAAAVTKVLERPKDSWREALNAARRQMVWQTQEPVLLSIVQNSLDGKI